MLRVLRHLSASLSTIGVQMETTFADFDETDLILLWGANPPTDSPPNRVKKILAAKKRGARVIAIDHMRSDIAKMADQWVGVRSGTDGALALSMINVIINEHLYDEAFVRNWTKGFEELRQYVQQFPPEKAETITRVPRETISAMARQIAKAKGASLVMYTGLEYTNSGVQNHPIRPEPLGDHGESGRSRRVGVQTAQPGPVPTRQPGPAKRCETHRRRQVSPVL